MANSKARSTGRPGSGSPSRSARTMAAVKATPNSRPVIRPTVEAFDPDEPADAMIEAAPARPAGQPTWLQVVSFVLAIIGLGISSYETWAHFHGSHLAGCSTTGGGCTAVITSPQSMVFGVIPVAILGLAFYVAAVPLFSPWAWRMKRREVHLVRLASMVVGMGFVMYLIYAELYQIGSICEYCTGVHIVTFLLFCITVFSAAIWGLRGREEQATLPG